MRVILDGLGHRFNDQPWLFRHLSTTLTPGDVYALTGPSGSGKSTLLGIISGWIPPAEGACTLEDVDTVQWVFQSPHGVAQRTAQDHAALPFVARGEDHRQARALAEPILERFGLASRVHAPFHELSGGEAQRLMLAVAVASAPDLMLVDEPTAQLDMVTRVAVADAIAQLADERTIVVVATHDDITRDACTAQIDLAQLARLQGPQP